jgi:pimeloyl-ACP methyl ester carboxylesterase
MMRWIFAILLAASAYGAACETAGPECQEHVPVAGGKFLVVYRSRPLAMRDEAIERVFILVHGLGRDGDSYYKTAISATREAGRLGNTLVIAPQFHAKDGNCKDATENAEAVFACRGWQDGNSTADAPLSSFAAMDELVRAVANRERFPKMTGIIVAGHSAGGQFVQRYAAVNRVDGKVGVPLRYVVANPSSYLYLESWRPVAEPGKACPGFDRYKFGMQGLTGYVAETGAAAIRSEYPRRNVTYLLGELDTTDEHNMDKTCPAMAQGPNRFARGVAYVDRLQKSFGATTHKLVKVPGCAHSGDCMYRSDAAKGVVFGIGHE